MSSLSRTSRGAEHTTKPTKTSRIKSFPLKEGHEVEIKEIDDVSELNALEQNTQGPTLLWGPAAQVVSGVTGLGSLYVRASSKIGGWGIAAGREATLKSLEVSRAAIEIVLLAAGRDVAARRSGEIGKAEAENALEKSISTLHSTIASISYVASAGFYLTQASIDTFSVLSIQGLSTLNSVLGSTESSRAVAAIITLVKNELNKPGPGEHGEIVSYVDLLLGTIGFVLLQRWGRRKTEMEFRDSGGEETIWDTVIDDRGFRADVVGTQRKDRLMAVKSMTRVDAGPDSNGDTAMVLEKGLELDSQSLRLSAHEQAHLSDGEIRDRIMSQLAPGTRATITTDTMTVKTVTVDIHEGSTAHIEPPPGLTMVSESLNHDLAVGGEDLPHQTIVFRTSLTRSSSSDIKPVERLKLTSMDAMDTDPGDNEDVVMMSPIRPSIEVQLPSPPIGFDSEKPLPRTPGTVANQKKSRKPVFASSPQPEKKASRLPVATPKPAKAQKDGVLKKALKSLSPTQSSTNVQSERPRSPSVTRRDTAPLPGMSPLTQRSGLSLGPTKRVFPMPESSITSPINSPVLLSPAPRDNAPAYFTMHEKRRESTVSQTDTYSLHSTESRPSSPPLMRTHVRTGSGILKTKSQTEISMQNGDHLDAADGERHHRRVKSFVPSLYSMGTKHSDEAIILAPKTPVRRSIFEDHKMLTALATDGKVPGMFPNQHHFVKTVRRFARFASASYGAAAMRFMGIASTDLNVIKSADLATQDIHFEHSSFSTHTGLPADSILLSSFVDPKGASGNAGLSQNVMSPLVHFVSIDHESKAVVLTCRGTLGFEDVLADMTCDYDNIYWQGKNYKVHKGIHASARRLLSGVGSRVMATIKAALEEWPEYGLVLCGHSLGGAVAAIVAVLISEPAKGDSPEATFIIKAMPKMITGPTSMSSAPHITLPVGRPIHVYSYGSPAIFSPGLRLVTRGLITTIINDCDFIPHLSLGTLHDFRAIGLHLKKDTSDTMATLRDRVMKRMKDMLYSAVWAAPDKGPPPPEDAAGDGLGEDAWAWKALNTLRKEMNSEKLIPAGECFVIETTRVFDRHNPNDLSAASDPDDPPEARYFRDLGRPATRVQFKLIRDVERRFHEMRFGSHMFGDHFPGRYEAALNALEKGVLDC